MCETLCFLVIQRVEQLGRLSRQSKGNKTGIKGAIPQSRLDTERVVRTSLNHVATSSRQRTYKENKDLIGAIQWLSTLDSRTSFTCMNFDGPIV